MGRFGQRPRFIIALIFGHPRRKLETFVLKPDSFGYDSEREFNVYIVGAFNCPDLERGRRPVADIKFRVTVGL